MINTIQHPSSLVLGALSLLFAVTPGCSADPADEAAGATQQAILCQGQGCDGILPNDSPCKADMVDTGIGTTIVDASGKIIGGIGLFRSPSCQTVWASSSFYVAGGTRNFRICAVRVRASQNDPSCADYSSSYGNDSPMKFANSGKTVFGKITVDGMTTRTTNFTVP
jgi:hypothetical protein